MNQALGERELNWLDAFLFRRIDEGDISGRDPGILDVSELDGFFTAIVSGPKVIPASQWLPRLWGDDEPVWENMEDLRTAFELMRRHMNCIDATLMLRPQAFEPMFLQLKCCTGTSVMVDAWCRGYMRGVLLASEHWRLDELCLEILLVPIKAFNGEQARRTYDCFSHAEIENIQHAISRHARGIYAYWRACRRHDSRALFPASKGTPLIRQRVDYRYEKYRKCSLH